MLEAALVVGLLGLLVYATMLVLTRPEPRRRAVPRGGAWRVAHHDLRGRTHVVLQKVSGIEVLDEHEVATLRADDPEYDAKFLAAMATARERLALFEAEDE